MPTTRTQSTLLVLGLMSLLSGCATAQFQVSVTSAGPYNRAKDKAIEERARALPWDREYPVEVYVGTTPEGLRLDGHKLNVLPGFEPRYSILGTVRSAHLYNPTASYARSMFWYENMHDQHSSFRDIFCKVQTPLRTLTLGIWGLVSPLSWACWVWYPTSEQDNVPIHAQELKRAATAMGANVVVMTGLGTESHVAGSRFGVQTYTVEAPRAEGFAVLDRLREGDIRRPSPR